MARKYTRKVRRNKRHTRRRGGNWFARLLGRENPVLSSKPPKHLEQEQEPHQYTYPRTNLGNKGPSSLRRNGQRSLSLETNPPAQNGPLRRNSAIGTANEDPIAGHTTSQRSSIASEPGSVAASPRTSGVAPLQKVAPSNNNYNTSKQKYNSALKAYRASHGLINTGNKLPVLTKNQENKLRAAGLI